MNEPLPQEAMVTLPATELSEPTVTVVHGPLLTTLRSPFTLVRLPRSRLLADVSFVTVTFPLVVSEPRSRLLADVSLLTVTLPLVVKAPRSRLLADVSLLTVTSPLVVKEPRLMFEAVVSLVTV